MRHLTKLFILFAVASMTVVACRKDSNPSAYLTPESFTYEAPYQAGELTMSFKTNVKDLVVETECEWISVLSSTTSSLTIRIQANDETTARTAEIRFYNEESLLNKINVKQAAAPSSIDIGYNSLTVEAGAGSVELQFSANFDFTLETTVPWISLTPFTKPVEISSITLYFQKNESPEDRKGNVIIKESASGKEMASIEITQSGAKLLGFYFLNEGQWGKNNASLGYFDLSAGTLNSDWWAALNPTVRGSLGDVANDIVATDDYLLVAVNSSNLLEICDRDGKHLREVEIPNCRMIAWDGTYAYVSSYADDGYVAKVNPATGNIAAKCTVGHEPEGLAIIGKKLYVLNSCSYHTDFTGGGNNETASVSIIDLDSFKETEKVSLGVINAYSPLTLMPDGKSFYINSSGDYNAVAASSLIFDTESKSVTKNFDFGGTYACTYDSKLYIFETSFSYTTYEWENNNCVYNPATGTLTDFPVDEDEFYTFGAPSGLWINPLNGDIYIADKGNYMSPGFLYRFSSNGTQTGKFTVGVCPGHLAWDWR